MDKRTHFRKLQQMYLAAPITQQVYPDSQIIVEDGIATIQMNVKEKFHHAAGSLHGSVYFRLLDDAAYFAASSKEPNFFLLTKEYQIEFIRPLINGSVKAIGQALTENEKDITAEAKLYNEQGKLVAQGKGVFARSKIKFEQLSSY